jgi:Cof subfamily protein (haloacid dehalogenase superfamily)
VSARPAYDLLVCDLDGTLIDKSMILDPALVAAFNRAREGGLTISLATGRMPPGAERYREELGITAPCIFYNGALVRDPVTGQNHYAVTLPRGLLRETYRIFSLAPVHPLFYRDDRLFCLERTFPVRDYGDAQGLEVEVIPDPDDFLALGSFVKGLFIGHPAMLPVLREELGVAAGPDARLVMTRADYLELIPAVASKGAALRRLTEHLGVPLERVIAVGDQENDLEMLEAAGLGLAMPEAPERVRAAAGRVVPSAADGGLLAVLREALPEYFA